MTTINVNYGLTLDEYKVDVRKLIARECKLSPAEADLAVATLNSEINILFTHGQTATQTVKILLKQVFTRWVEIVQQLQAMTAEDEAATTK